MLARQEPLYGDCNCRTQSNEEAKHRLKNGESAALRFKLNPDIMKFTVSAMYYTRAQLSFSLFQI